MYHEYMSKLDQKLKTKNRRPIAGFTLIELLVVIGIISILASLLMANFVGVRQRGRDGQRKSDLRQIQSALELYRADNGSYPNAIYSVSCPTSSALTSGSGTTYITRVPCDPLDKSTGYVYTYSAVNNSYTLYSCLENVNDADEDAADGGAGDQCGTTGRVSFTVKNP